MLGCGVLHFTVSVRHTLSPPQPALPLYATDLHDRQIEGDTPLYLDGLPEARWYRQADPGKIVVYPPPTLNHEHGRPLTIATTEFWKLIAWHDLTHANKPLESSQYDARARDIHAVIGQTAGRTPKEDSLCWATHRTLLHIICEELQCDTELFSDLMNTSPLFKKRRSLAIHQAFRRHGGLQQDGLDPTAYEGSVYANPPYDGSTIEASMNIARERASRPGFRATYFVPMTAKRLAEFKKEPRSTLLMRFPTNTVPFIHAEYWRGNSQRNGGLRKWYDEKHTEMVLVMIQSDDLAHLRPVNIHNLQEKLAAWHISVMPPHLRSLRTYRETEISLEHFKPWTMPDMWRIWEPPGNGTNLGHDNNYPGASTDNTLINSCPARDAITWNHELALMGVFPDSYHKFLRNIGHKSSEVGRIARVLALTLRKHLRGSYYTFQALARREPQPTTPNPTAQQRTTSNRTRTAGNARSRALQDREHHRDSIRRGKQKVNLLPKHMRDRLTPGTNQAESGPSGVRKAQRRTGPERTQTQTPEQTQACRRTGLPTTWGPGTNAQTSVPSDVRDTARGEGGSWWSGRRVRRRTDGPPHSHTHGATHTYPCEPIARPDTDPRIEAWPHIRRLLRDNATLLTPALKTAVFLTVSLAMIWKSLVRLGGRNFGNNLFGLLVWPHFLAHHALALFASHSEISDNEESTP